MNIKAMDNGMNISVGSPSFFFSFYSTIVCNIPAYQKYPTSMEFLQKGRLPASVCDTAAIELELLRKELDALSPDHVVWDMNDRTKQPPWKNNISPHINSLGNYFVTADGKDLFDELIALMRYASEHHTDVVLLK